MKQEEVINIANIQSGLGNSFRITRHQQPERSPSAVTAAACRWLIAPISDLLKNVPLADPGYAEH
ncbi:hypothetical protein ACNKHU_02170 [Shigella flexneri]